MKICSKCNKEKSIEEFDENKWYEDGYNGRCKQCIQEWEDSLDDTDEEYEIPEPKEIVWCVYLLPQHNYVGVSKNLQNRLSNHKSLGRTVDDFVVLDYFNSKEEALKKETWYHSIGYGGKQNLRGKDILWH